MCLVIYVASNLELPVTEWDASAPSFFLESVPEGQQVRQQFSLPNVYYAGSHLGCGCGYLKADEVGEEFEAHQANYINLAQCLREVQSKGGSLELFSCWEGDQVRKPEFVESISVAELEQPAFQFKELQFIRVRHTDA